MESILAPSGTVTFLFTDVEKSTELWARVPEQMSLALRIHDDLLQEVITGGGGHIFKTVGDGFYVAFSDPSKAVKAAAEIQSKLLTVNWPPGCQLKVRIAVHSGIAEQRNNDYFGNTLNRTARLRDIACGGQILASGAIAEILRETLPTNIELSYLCTVTLKGLSREEKVYQVNKEGLETQFSAIEKQSTNGTNIVQPLTHFIGRTKEIETLRDRVAKNRLISIVGPGGAGKTRLSQHIAPKMLEFTKEGVWFIEFATINDDSLIESTIMDAIGLKSENSDDENSNLYQKIKKWSCVLVLDNCEHVISSISRIVSRILAQCESVKILITSREPLGIAGEHIVRIGNLTLPDLDKGVSVKTLSLFDGTCLFVDRAKNVSDGFLNNDIEAALIAKICTRLDGIPLAIELAASRIKTMSLANIEERLDERFNLLTGSRITHLPRHKTLKACFEWSYDLLTTDEKLALQRFAVFQGGWTLEACEKVAGYDPLEEFDIVDLLSALVEKSLVTFSQSAGDSRYKLLETIRSFVLETYQVETEIATVQRSHAMYFSQQVRELAQKADEANLRDFLEIEIDNIRKCSEWLNQNDPVLGQELLVNASCLWYLGGRLEEGYKRCLNLLEREALPQPLQCELYVYGGVYHLKIYREDQSFELLKKAYEIAINLRDPKLIFLTIHNFSGVYNLRGMFQQSIDLCLEGRKIIKEIDGNHTVDFPNLSEAYLNLGLYDAAKVELVTFSERKRRSQRTMSDIYRQLALIDLYENKFKDCYHHCVESLQICSVAQDSELLPQTLQVCIALGIELSDFGFSATVVGMINNILKPENRSFENIDSHGREQTISILKDAIGEKEYFNRLVEGAKIPVREICHYFEQELGHHFSHA